VGTDVVVVGGGIAGVSAAYHLATAGLDVVLVEAEAALAHHTTGRSAAQYLATYGGAVNQVLTVASRAFFDDPPAGLVDAPLLQPVPFLSIGGPDERAELAAAAAAAAAVVSSVRLLSAAEAVACCPVLRPELLGGAVLEPEAMDIDVMALHQGFVRGAVAAGALVRRSAPVVAIDRVAERWHVAVGAETLTADVVVNAAGAWGDRIAGLAGLEPLGLQPLRRTAFTTSVPVDTHGWPLVHPLDGTFYFKPEAGGQLLCSLADETPSEPCDARPEELDIALTIERVNTATTLAISTVRSSWAGLRTFAPDRNPVIGPEPSVPSFVWMVGQGGTGIQTAPAAGRALAALVLHGELPGELLAAGLTTSALARRD
jgi:D-arginine dehydrogenase